MRTTVILIILWLLLIVVIALGVRNMAHAAPTHARATMQPYPTNAPATPGPSPTPPAAYPPPYPVPARLSVAPVLLSATFVTSSSAIVAWEQPAEMANGITCLRIYHVGAEWPAGICWRDLEAGPVQVALPGELTHPAYRPQISDRIVLAFGMDDVGCTTLGESAVYTTYLPLTTNQSAPFNTVRLPVVRR